MAPEPPPRRETIDAVIEIPGGSRCKYEWDHGRRLDPSRVVSFETMRRATRG
jgi:hypothetical protein